jgi:hypothetical protein
MAGISDRQIFSWVDVYHEDINTVLACHNDIEGSVMHAMKT